jgi:hypothetical protein
MDAAVSISFELGAHDEKRQERSITGVIMRFIDSNNTPTAGIVVV